jgi:hypothetical protein
MGKHDNNSEDRTPSPATEKAIDEHAHHLDEANTLDDRFPDPDAGKTDEERALIVRDNGSPGPGLLLTRIQDKKLLRRLDIRIIP